MARQSTQAERRWTEILDRIPTDVRILALILLVTEAIYGGTLMAVEQKLRLWVFLVNSFLILCIIVGFFLTRQPSMHGSPKTPTDPLIGKLVNGAIEVVCRAASLPLSPEKARLRVFIFKRDRNQLVCTHFYAANPGREEVDVLRFDIDSDTAKLIVVVRAFLDRRVCVERLRESGEGRKGVHGRISRDLLTVLAAPIMMKDGTCWGIVDFDTSTEAGAALLISDVADATIHALAAHLALLVSLDRTAVTVTG